MKKILFFICLVAVAAAACKEEAGLGAPTEIAPAYTLPQPGTSAEASAWFVKMHNDYGSYFIWDFTEKDALWTIVSGSTNYVNPDYNYITPGDPEYADEMIEFLKSAWLKNVSEDHLRDGGIPFRVFLADTVGQVDSTRIAQGAPAFHNPVNIRVVSGNSIIISGMNRNLPTMTPAEKIAKSVDILKALFPAPAAPEEFYKVSDYTERPSWLPGGAVYETVTPGNTFPLTISGNGTATWTAPDGTEYTYDRAWGRRMIAEEMAKRGFIMSFNPTAGWLYAPNPSSPMNHNYPSGWFNSPVTVEEQLMGYDKGHQWEDWLWKATDEQLDEAGIFDPVEYPLLWEKWQIRIKAYNDAGLDIRAVANGR